MTLDHELRAATPFRHGEGWTVVCATCEWVGGIWSGHDQASAGYMRHLRLDHPLLADQETTP